MRNKVAESLANAQTGDAASYVGSAYTLIGLLAIVLWIVFTVGSSFISWQIVFNTTTIPEPTLRDTVHIVVSFILFNFVITLINTLLGAVQRTSLVALGQLISNVLVLVLVFLLSKTTEASINSLALVYGISTVVSNLFLSIWFYGNRPELRPRFNLDKNHVRPLLAVGFQFFIIQVAVLVIFTTDKILITHIFGPEYVTQYEVVFKLFSVITFAHGLISAPLWSAYTEAYHKEDFKWIRRMLRTQLIIFFGIVVAIFLLTAMAESIIEVWIGKGFEITSELLVATGLFVTISTWNNIFAMFVNGIGKIKIQLYTALIAMCANIPISIFLAKNTDLGTSAIIIGTTCSLLLAAVVLPIQVHHLIRRS